MSTGKQNAVHAQQNSDGTFELLVEPSEGYDFDSEINLEPPPSQPRRKIPFRAIGIVIFGLLAVSAIVYFVMTLGSSRVDTDIALEPVAGFKPHMAGAGAPAVKARSRAPIPEPQEDVEEREENEEIREEESPSIPPVIEAEPMEAPLPPPAILQQQQPEAIEESEIAPEEAGWQVDEPEEASDEQSNLMDRGLLKNRLDEFRKESELAQPTIAFENLARGRRAVNSRTFENIGVVGRNARRGRLSGKEFLTKQE